METGKVVLGTKAIFFELFENGPVIPGPDIKNPKTSLKVEQLYSGYSSEAKTYSNCTEVLVGTKSNSKTATFLTAGVTNC